MIDESTMYWITRLDHVHTLLEPFVILGCALGIMGVILAAAHRCVEGRSIGFPLEALACCLLFVGTLSGLAKALIPTTREYVAIKVVPMIANNEDVQGLSKDALDLAREWMDELKPDKGGGDE